MRVNEGKHLDWWRCQQFGFFCFVGPLEQWHWHPVQISVQSRAQLVSSSARDFRMLRHRASICRTTIDAYGFVIGIQDTPRKISGGEVVNAIAHGPGWLDAPGHDSRHGSRDYVVRGWHQPVVVVHVQAPAKLELSQVAQTGSPF